MPATNSDNHDRDPSAVSNAPAAQAGDEVSLPSGAADPADSTAALRAELQQAQDRALRAQAELENFRKRARRDADEAVRFAQVPLIRDLLGVLDNLLRALASASSEAAPSGLGEGVQLVAQQLQGILEQHGCRRIPDVGVPFDPHQHEAIGREPSTEYPAETVTRVVRNGYFLHDRVVRPAQVMISSGPPAS
jgi:molecular chaperone GrpE